MKYKMILLFLVMPMIKPADELVLPATTIVKQPIPQDIPEAPDAPVDEKECKMCWICVCVGIFFSTLERHPAPQE